MVTSSHTCCTATAENLPFGDLITRLDIKLTHVCIKSLQSEPVVYDHTLAIDTEIVSKQNFTIIGRRNFCTGNRGEIVTEMNGGIYLLSFVEIVAIIGK